jgi:hypothetical protein
MGNPSFQANGPISQTINTIGSGGTFSDPFITVFNTRDPDNTTTQDANYPVKKRWINLASGPKEWILQNFSNISGQTLPNWILLSNGSAGLITLTGNTGGPVPPTGNNINVVGDGTTITIAGNPGTSTLTVSLIGGLSMISKVQVDAAFAPGVNPVVANNGLIEIGESFATHTPLPTGTNAAGYETVTRAANEFGIELQLAGSHPASATANNFGISQFDGNQFTVTNGFVQITNFSPFNYVSVNHAASPYTATATDYFISCDPTAGVITIKLPNAPTQFRQFVIKDRTGQASTNNISVTTAGGIVTIDGQTTYTMAGNFDAINLLFNGTSYEVY